MGIKMDADDLDLCLFVFFICVYLWIIFIIFLLIKDYGFQFMVDSIIELGRRMGLIF